MMRFWVASLLFLGLPLAEGTLNPADEGDLWLRTGLDSSFISRFILNTNCAKSPQWTEACRRGVERGLEYLNPGPQAEEIRNLWKLSADFEAIVRRLDQAETRAPKPLVWGSMANALISTFDPFARIQPEGYQQTVGTGAHNETGIGAQFEITSEGLIVRRIFPGSPAQLAGLNVHDRLISVDGELAGQGLKAFDTIGKLRGRMGKHVLVEIRRGSFQMKRFLIFKRIVNRDVGLRIVDVLNRRHAWITVYNFTKGVCDQVQEQVRTAQDKNAVGVILDLRFNVGGLTDEGLCIAKIFTDSSKPLVTHEFLKTSLLPAELELNPRMLNSVPEQENDLLPWVREFQLPLAVLVNAGTASISEILAAALQDLGRAWIVGTGTMGKGTFQLRAPMNGNKSLVLRHTICEAVRPSGASVHYYGVTPNFTVSARRGESVHPYRMLQDPEFVPHPILPNHQNLWRESRPKEAKVLLACAGGGRADLYAGHLTRLLGFDDYQQAYAMAVLQCEGDLPARN